MDGVTPEVKQMLQLTKNNAEWFAWGGSHLNWEKILNFNPATGKPFTAENDTENYLSWTEALYPYGKGELNLTAPFCAKKIPSWPHKALVIDRNNFTVYDETVLASSASGNKIMRYTENVTWKITFVV